MKSTGTVRSWDSGSDLLGNVVNNLITVRSLVYELMPLLAFLLLPPAFPRAVHGMPPLFFLSSAIPSGNTSKLSVVGKP